MKRTITKKKQTPRKTKDAQCSCSPPAERCSASPQAVIPPPQLIPPVYYTGHDTLWHRISLWAAWVS